jgi:hypothetical protein
MRFRPLLAAAALFSLAPATSFAISPCGAICERGNCNTPCSEGGGIITTCREAGYCSDLSNGADPSAAVTEAQSQQADEAPVCSEAHPDAEQSKSSAS